MATGAAHTGVPGLNCPVCSQPTAVLEKRGNERRRECTACKHRFSTIEKLRDVDRRQAEALRAAVDLAEKVIRAA